MTVAISVTGDALLGFEITATGLSGYYRARVMRQDMSGHYEETAVRNMDMVDATGGTVINIDYEAPINTELIYSVELYHVSDLVNPATAVSADPVETVLPTDFAILIDPLDPGQRLALNVIDLDEWTYDYPVLGEHKVLGRRNPVINSDVEAGRSGEIFVSNFNVYDEIDWDDTGFYPRYQILAHMNWNTLFRSGQTLLFRSTWTETAFDDCYMKITSRTVNRPEAVGGRAGQVFLTHKLNYKEQDRPLTSLPSLGLSTWQIVMDSNADWAEVETDHADWLSVATDPDL